MSFSPEFHSDGFALREEREDHPPDSASIQSPWTDTQQQSYPLSYSEQPDPSVRLQPLSDIPPVDFSLDLGVNDFGFVPLSSPSMRGHVSLPDFNSLPDDELYYGHSLDLAPPVVPSQSAPLVTQCRPGRYLNSRLRARPSRPTVELDGIRSKRYPLPLVHSKSELHQPSPSI